MLGEASHCSDARDGPMYIEMLPLRVLYIRGSTAAEGK